MTWTVSASGTQTADGAEDSLTTDATNATYVLMADLCKLQPTDVVELRLYVQPLGATAIYREAWKASFAGTQLSFQSAAAGSFTTASTTITVASGLPIFPGMNVYDQTTGSNVGTVQSYTSTTLTLTTTSAINSSGSTDVLSYSNTAVQSPFVPSNNSIKATLKQVAGTNRTFDWSLLRQ